MGIYTDQVLPRVQNKVMDREPLRPIRARVCAGLKGAIVGDTSEHTRDLQDRP